MNLMLWRHYSTPFQNTNSRFDHSKKQLFFRFVAQGDNRHHAVYLSGLCLWLLSSAVLFKHFQGDFLHHWSLRSGVCYEQALIPHRQDPWQQHSIRPIRIYERTIQLSVFGVEEDVNTQMDRFITLQLVLLSAVCSYSLLFTSVF